MNALRPPRRVKIGGGFVTWEFNLLFLPFEMKFTLAFWLGCLLAVSLLPGCIVSREARVESDYSYGGRFRRYRSYSFITGTGLAADTSHLGETLRDAIRQRLRSQGYRPARGTNRPDLLVSFRIFEGDMHFHGFNQEELTTWVKNNDAESDETPDEQRHMYQPVRLLLAEGTLLVTLIDARSNRAVWNGYASGVTVPEGLRGEVVLVRSVRSIFDRYRIFTENYFQRLHPWALPLET